jgi:adenosylhomocysteine nucleosidase
MTAPLLVVMALEIESQGLFAEASVDVLYTGLGKVNAAHRLTRRLAEERARGVTPLVVNFGTVGSRRFETGALVGCHRFVQRDMDVTGLGFALGETPFESLPAELSFPVVFGDLPAGVCASGDRFEAIDRELPWDVVDMEAYALAKVCLLEEVPFACAKFVTDGANGTAAGDWQANLPLAARAFLELYRRLSLA